MAAGLEADVIDLAGRRVAVTGAGGFIGTHLVERLAAAAAGVLCLGDSPRVTPRVATLVASGVVRTVDTRVAAGYAAAYALAGCDSLVHLAYRPPVPGAADRMDAEIAGNVGPTLALLDLAEAAGVTHVTFASTAGVYGPGVGLDEAAPAAGASAYEMVKLDQERAVAAWAERTHRAAAVLRLSTVYGPGEPVRRAIPAFIDAVLAGAPPVVSGEGRGPFDPIYVGDVVDAFARAVERRAQGVFNIGTGIARAPVDVAELTARLIGFRVPVVHNRFAPDRPRPVCDVSRARCALGFTARTPIEVGIAAQVEWARQRV